MSADGGGHYGGYGSAHGYGGAGAGQAHSFYNHNAGARSTSGYQIYRTVPSSHHAVVNGRVAPSQQSQNFHANRNATVVNKANQHAAGLNQKRRGNNALGQKAIATRDGGTHQGNWARNNPKNKNRFDQNTQDRLRNWDGKKSSWAEARHQNEDSHHHHHGHDWWHHHCRAIIFVDDGWWAWNDGWWYPAWGYDSYDSNYRYDQPIYDYNGLPPDEVIANLQSDLQQLGYYSSKVDGVFGPLTRQALKRFQRDKGLEVTGAIDPATAEALGWGQ